MDEATLDQLAARMGISGPLSADQRTALFQANALAVLAVAMTSIAKTSTDDPLVESLKTIADDFTSIAADFRTLPKAA